MYSFSNGSNQPTPFCCSILASFRSRQSGGAGPPTSNTRELIAPAVAITLRCDGCIAVHLAAAGKPGATREEIAEALGVGISVNADAALVYSARTLDAFDATA